MRQQRIGILHLICISLAIGTLIASPSTLAANTTEIDCGLQPIRLAHYENGYFYFTNGAHQAQGIDKDLVDELAKRSGCKFDMQVMVRARIWADLASGEVDMSTSGIQTPERDRFAWFAHYLRIKNYVVVRRNASHQTLHATDFLAQPNLIFGAIRAYKHGEEQEHWLQQLRQAGRVQESADADSIFKKIKEKRVDAMYAPVHVYRKKTLELGLQNEVLIQDWAPQDKGVAHGMILSKSRFSEKQAQQWRNLIEGMRTDGSLKRIFERYLPPNEAAKLLGQ